jgi:hypothetical protein
MAIWLTLIFLPIALHLWLHMTLIVARLQLGRWPHRWGMDDPKYIPIVAELHTPLYLLLLFVTPVFPILVICTLAGALLRDWRLGLLMLWISVVVWGGLYVIGDPAEVWVWFFD